MRVKLKSIASVQMGYSFRSKLNVDAGGSVAVVQMKDLREDNVVECSELVRVDMGNVKDRHFVKSGDLVFRSRGLVTTSAIIRDDIGLALVGAPLLRIRVEDVNKVLPEYLNWYISQREAQRYFASRQVVTSVNTVNKQQLEELEVMVPELEKQKKIVELISLMEREQILLKGLAEKRGQYISKKLMQIAGGK